MSLFSKNDDPPAIEVSLDRIADALEEILARLTPARAGAERPAALRRPRRVLRARRDGHLPHLRRDRRVHLVLSELQRLRAGAEMSSHYELGANGTWHTITHGVWHSTDGVWLMFGHLDDCLAMAMEFNGRHLHVWDVRDAFEPPLDPGHPEAGHQMSWPECECGLLACTRCYPAHDEVRSVPIAEVYTTQGTHVRTITSDPVVDAPAGRDFDEGCETVVSHSAELLWKVACSCGFTVDYLSTLEAAEDVSAFHHGEPSMLGGDL